jgi:hypothetical protein
MEWCRATGLEPGTPVALPAEQLTVMLWPARRPGGAASGGAALDREDVASC